MQPAEVLTDLLRGATLDEQRAEAVFESVLSGRFDDAQIAGLLSLIQARGATVDELVGAARVMRRHVRRVPIDEPGAAVIDTCGTGGAPKTFNISTAAAIVVAAASPHHLGGSLRVLVAKHGNRSRSGRGSAEVLAHLGVNVDAGPEAQARCLREAGVCFCFAIHHHPAAKAAAGARRSLGFPTIFNLLGPLTNPAGASRQLIGIYARGLVPTMAEALARLGSERAMVVHGHDGMDEITTTGPSTVAHVEHGRVELREVDPASLSAPRASADELCAQSLTEAAGIIQGVLAGQSGPARDIVMVNAGAALVVSSAAPTIQEGMRMAAEAIDSGRAGRTLSMLARLSHEGAS